MEEYEVIFRNSLGEIIQLSEGQFRLLCYGITLSREVKIMSDLEKVLAQTNTVSVFDKDPLEDISWFSGDFAREHLHTVIRYIEER